MLELYHWEPNIFFLKPLIALAEKGTAYTSRYFDPTQFEQFAAAFPADTESRLQLEREGPVLVHDGTIISSSAFQLEYIAEAFPGPPLLPQDPFERYRVHALGQMIALLVTAPVTALGCARYLVPALRSQPAPALKQRLASIEPLERRAAWMAVLEGSEERAAEAARAQLERPLRRVEAALTSSPWFAGREYSIADIDAFAMLRNLPELAPTLVNRSATPQLLQFLEHMQARPAVRAALALARSAHPEQAFVPGAEPSRWG